MSFGQEDILYERPMIFKKLLLLPFKFKPHLKGAHLMESKFIAHLSAVCIKFYNLWVYYKLA